MPNAAVTDWKPSAQPGRYDQARVAQMQPIETAIDGLDLPLNRLRNYMKLKGMWSEAHETELTERYNNEITAAMARAEALPPPDIDTLFDDVYEEMPWNLREQKAWLMEQARTKSPHHH